VSERPPASEAFAAADGDGDGRLNRAEMRAVAVALLPNEPWDDALWPVMCADCGVDPEEGFGPAEFAEFAEFLLMKPAAGPPHSRRRRTRQAHSALQAVHNAFSGTEGVPSPQRSGNEGVGGGLGGAVDSPWTEGAAEGAVDTLVRIPVPGGPVNQPAGLHH
jgi:hypothetical protein